MIPSLFTSQLSSIAPIFLKSSIVGFTPLLLIAFVFTLTGCDKNRKVDFELMAGSMVSKENMTEDEMRMHDAKVIQYAIYQTKLTDGGFWLKLTVGQMSSLLTYGIQILMSIMMISMILVFMVMSFECINRVGEVLMEEPTIKNPENPVMELADGSVQFNNVNFRYVETAEKNALENINKATNSIPLVLHGGTGIPDDQIVHAIKNGVSKINVNTDCQLVFAQATIEYCAAGKANPSGDNKEKGYDPRKLLKPGFEAIKAKVKEKMELFGSVGKAA